MNSFLILVLLILVSSYEYKKKAMDWGKRKQAHAKLLSKCSANASGNLQIIRGCHAEGKEQQQLGGLKMGRTRTLAHRATRIFTRTA